MEIVGDILWWVLLVYLVAVFARVVIGWLPIKWPRGIRPLVVFIYDITEPLLSPLRRVLPMIPVGEGVALDLAPMALIFTIFFLQWLVRRVFG